jgi:hypothetical protein
MIIMTFCGSQKPQKMNNQIRSSTKVGERKYPRHFQFFPKNCGTFCLKAKKNGTLFLGLTNEIKMREDSVGVLIFETMDANFALAERITITGFKFLSRNTLVTVNNDSVYKDSKHFNMYYEYFHENGIKDTYLLDTYKTGQWLCKGLFRKNGIATTTILGNCFFRNKHNSNDTISMQKLVLGGYIKYGG